jgi:hypothetical protein
MHTVVPSGSDALAEAKAALTPLLSKEEFSVFVFGPALRGGQQMRQPKCGTSSHANVARHAEYLRHRTKAALEAEGFTAALGETPSVLKFWQGFFSSPNEAVSEILEARKVCGAVVIFPASFGSLAELCLFARQGGIAEKTVAIVDKTYESASSFFRRGVLELFETFSGTTKFLDYKDEKACIQRVLTFVEGRYHRVLDEIDQGQYITARHRGHVFENTLRDSSH